MRNLLKRRSVKTLLEIGVFVLLYFGVQSYMQRHLASGNLPALQAKMLTGEVFDSAQQRDGPVLIHFWASWCQVCRLEQHSIQAISQQYSVIGIAMDSGNATAVERYMQQHGLDFPVINDPHGKIARRFGVMAVPASFIVDRHNKIRYVEQGYTTEWGLLLRLWLAS